MQAVCALPGQRAAVGGLDKTVRTAAAGFHGCCGSCNRAPSGAICCVVRALWMILLTLLPGEGREAEVEAG